MTRIRAVLFDIDGTLLDSNDAQAHAWLDALRGHGIDVPVDHVRARVGMHPDRLLAELADIEPHSVTARAIKERRSAILRGHYMDDLGPLPGARALVDRLRSRGLTCVALSAFARAETLELLRAATIADLIDLVIADEDLVETSSVRPDTRSPVRLVEIALERVSVPASEAVLVGDSPYDVEVATAAGVAAVAFRSGRFRDAELADAIAIYDGPSDLCSRLDQSPFARGIEEGSRAPFSPRPRRPAMRGGA